MVLYLSWLTRPGGVGQTAPLHQSFGGVEANNLQDPSRRSKLSHILSPPRHFHSFSRPCPPSPRAPSRHPQIPKVQISLDSPKASISQITWTNLPPFLAQDQAQQPPSTVSQRSQQRFHVTNPLSQRVQSSGLAALTPAEKKTFVYTQLLQPVAQQRIPLSNKTEREFWKAVAKEALPIRRLREDYAWGADKSGRDIGTYSLSEYEARSVKQAKLTALSLLSKEFCTKRELAESAKQAGKEASKVAAAEIEAERTRRKEMAGLKRELYGEITGPLASDPEWDDVIPILHEEAEDAVARIAYPDDYAEGMF